MPGYTLWMAGSTQIAGLMAQPPAAGPTPPHWLIYIGTPSVDDTCARAQGLGARVLKAPADIPSVGRFAVLADPQGATFAVFTPGAGQPAPIPPAHGGFSWHELATTDVAGALRFYGELFGWRKGPGHDMGAMGVYQIFEHGGKQGGGMCRPGSAQAAPSWLSYVHVVDSNRAVAGAKAGGGRLVHGPMEVPGGSWIALLIDPQGGAFAVQEAPRAMARAQPAAAKPAPAPAAKPAAAAKPAKKAKQAQKAAKKPARKAAKKKARKPARRKAARASARKSARRSARRASSRKGGRGRRRR